MSDSPKTLKLTLSETATLLGLAMLVGSLTLPAVKHGKVMLGFECFIVSSILAFSPPSPSATASQLIMMARVALLVQLCAAIVTVMVFLKVRTNSAAKSIPSGLVLLGCFYLVTIPYSGIETAYAGFYMWLASLVLLAIGPYFERFAPASFTCVR
jgi:hypothetical protein